LPPEKALAEERPDLWRTRFWSRVLSHVFVGLHCFTG
jgi:hypothetical protein